VALFIGMAFGIVVGAIPGVSATIGVTVALPLTLNGLLIFLNQNTCKLFDLLTFCEQIDLINII
jgi:TctA family transporter